MKYKILVVDDEPANLRMLERLFHGEHEVITAGSGAEALELLNRYDVALIISDQRMPGMTGIEFLKQASQMRPQTVRIVLTGYTDVNDLVDAINCGVIYKYITKPWVNIDLRQTVERALEHFESTKTHHLTALENKRLDARLKTTVTGFIEAIRIISAQDEPAILEHGRRTSNYAMLIGREFDLGKDEINVISAAALLHEVVNLEMPYGVEVSDVDQYHALRDNYESRLKLISDVPDLEDVAVLIRYQHENFNGSGFFDGLSGDKIPLGSRILAVANAYDEVVSGMKPGMGSGASDAAAWLRSRAGSNFDPEVIQVLIDIESRGYDLNSDITKFIHQTDLPMAATV